MKKSFEKYDSGNCTICTKYFSLLHWHHTIPQALGGVDSLQIPLCSDCHNVLHAHANAYVARIRSGKGKMKNFWPRPGDLERAQPWLEILINSILNPLVTPEDKGYKMQVEVPSAMHQALNMLKQDLGAKSLESAILHCIANTLKSRGLYNDNRSTDQHSNVGRKEHRKESNQQPKKPTSELW